MQIFLADNENHRFRSVIWSKKCRWIRIII